MFPLPSPSFPPNDVVTSDEMAAAIARGHAAAAQRADDEALCLDPTCPFCFDQGVTR